MFFFSFYVFGWESFFRRCFALRGIVVRVRGILFTLFTGIVGSFSVFCFIIDIFINSFVKVSSSSYESFFEIDIERGGRAWGVFV